MKRLADGSGTMNRLDRRQFLTRCSGVAASALLPVGALALSNDPPRLSPQFFTVLIGQQFRGLDEHNVALNFMLRQVIAEPEAAGVEQFTLVFEETYRIDQERTGGLFQMVHPDTGPMLMHLEPSAKGPRAYAAHFSLLT